MKPFCLLPFYHLQIKRDGTVKPCCRFITQNGDLEFSPPKVKNNNLDEIFNSRMWKNIRKHMIDNKYIDRCKVCFEEEKYNLISMAKKSHLNSKDVDINNPKISFLEINMSNFCNLRCRTCSSDQSHSWFREDKILSMFGQLNRQAVELNRLDLDVSKLTNLKHIKFAGGESFADKKFASTLNILIENNPNCLIELYTNCSILSDKIIDILRKIKNLSIYLSIDGYGNKNDYLRKGSKWSEVERIAKWWISFAKRPGVNVKLQTTVSAYNILHLKEIIEWWNKISLNSVHIFNIVKFPEYLRPNVRSKSDLMKAGDILKEVKVARHLSSYFYKVIPIVDKRFMLFTKELDKIRGENYEEIYGVETDLKSSRKERNTNE